MKTFKKVVSTVGLLLILVWVAILVWDWARVNSGKEPMFCVARETHKYDDGEVLECLGLGYRSFIYKRDTLGGKEFGPFFIKEKQPEDIQN